MIEAFPIDKLFTYSVGDMRPFSKPVMEMLAMAVPEIKVLITGKWKDYDEASVVEPASKKELPGRWDETTETLNLLWPIARHRLLLYILFY